MRCLRFLSMCGLEMSLKAKNPMKLEVTRRVEGNYEYTHFMYHGLACPNPREYTRMTQSYEDMRREYDLLHPGEYSDLDMMRIMAEMGTESTFSSMLPYIMIMVMELIVLGFFAWPIISYHLF